MIIMYLYTKRLNKLIVVERNEEKSSHITAYKEKWMDFGERNLDLEWHHKNPPLYINFAHIPSH